MDKSIQINELMSEIEQLKKKISEGSLAKSASKQTEQEQSKSPAPIRGSVKATQPQLRPDQIVRPPIPRFIEESATPAIGFSPSVREATPANVSLSMSVEEVFQKWPALVAEACKQRIAVGSMLSETSLVEVQGNQFRVACPDDFHLDALKRNKQFLSDLAEGMFGAKIRLEAILANSHQPSAQQSGSITTPVETASTEPENDPLSHPLVKKVMKEFAGKKID
jgi:hypothetical protein